MDVTFSAEAEVKAIIVTGMALLWAGASWAADGVTPLDVKVGLWETKTSTDMGGMPRPQAQAPATIPPEALAKMSPEQRKRMEEMMKSRASGGPMTSTAKVCITKEQLANPMAFSRQDRSCKPTVVTSSGTKQVVHIDCDREGVKSTGDLTVERVDAGHLKGVMTVKTEQGPRPITMKTSFENTWLSSDCGDVKPPVAK